MEQEGWQGDKCKLKKAIKHRIDINESNIDCRPIWLCQDLDQDQQDLGHLDFQDIAEQYVSYIMFKYW